jgi:hypothetical protein
VKYPSVKRPDLLSVDVLDKRLDESTGKLHIRRLLVIEGCGYPNWLKKVLGSSVGYFVEDTVVDAHTQVLELRSRNITFASILRLEETCRYEPAPGRDADATLFTQTATVTALPYGMQAAMEFACVRSFHANAAKGRAIMEDTILRVRGEADQALARVKHEAERVAAEADDALLRVKAEVAEVKKKQSILFHRLSRLPFGMLESFE